MMGDKQDVGTRYRAIGRVVYQGDVIIARCHMGDQGQLPSDIAARIADLLNRDFRQFCINVCASATAESGDAQRRSHDD